MTSQKKNIIPLVIIIGLPLLLMGLSYSLIYLYKNQALDIPELVGTQTVGQLIAPPLKIEKLSLLNKQQHLFTNANKTAPWTLLVLPTSEKNLVQSRQMHIALGKHTHKLNRVFIAHDNLSESQQQALKSDHPKLRLAFSQNSDLLLSQNDYLLIDPRGWVMMYYAKGTDEKAMMDDLKHLFKYAQ